MGEQLKWTAAQFRAHTTVTPAGKKALSQPAGEVQPTGNLYSGIKPTFFIGIDPGVLRI